MSEGPQGPYQSGDRIGLGEAWGDLIEDGARLRDALLDVGHVHVDTWVNLVRIAANVVRWRWLQERDRSQLTGRVIAWAVPVVLVSWWLL